jgi:hypothetical protein
MDRMHHLGSNQGDKLDKLFAEYRAASPDPEPSADFMPGMWKRIEARRMATLSVFRHWAQICVMASVALTLLIGAVLIPRFQNTDSSSYLEALSAEHSSDYVHMLAGGPR